MANVKDVIKEAKCLEEQIAELTDKLNKDKALIQEFFDKKGLKVLEVEADNKGKDLIVKKKERVTITYIVDRLREKLNADLFNDVTTKTYMITDINGLISLLKKAGIKASEFKACIDASVNANTERLKQLYELGDFKLKDIEGCYEAKVTKSIKIDYKGEG